MMNVHHIDRMEADLSAQLVPRALSTVIAASWLSIIRVIKSSLCPRPSTYKPKNDSKSKRNVVKIRWSVLTKHRTFYLINKRWSHKTMVKILVKCLKKRKQGRKTSRQR